MPVLEEQLTTSANSNGQNIHSSITTYDAIQVEHVDIQLATPRVDEATQNSSDGELNKEQEEWDALESIQRTESGGIKLTPLISFSETLHHFQSEGIAKDKIRSTISRSGFAAFIQFLFGPPKINLSLVEERDLVFTIALKPLENCEVHHRVLQTIYKNLTGAKMDCPRIGSHWDTIGFQGTDPATDLRGTGFLSLLHTLHAVTDHNVSGIMSDIYKLSLDDEQQFPFCVMSINVTRIAIHVLREGKLNRECNRRKQVVSVMNDFYVALFWHIFHIWKIGHKTMLDSGHVMKEAEIEALKNPRKILRSFDEVLKNRRNKNTLPHTPLPPVSVQRSISAASSVNSAQMQSSIASKNSPRPTECSLQADKSDSGKNEPLFTDIREVGDFDDK